MKSEILKYGGSIGGIFTAIMVAVLIFQTSLMNENYVINNRPWIGGDQITVLDNVALIDVQNFGNIPNDGGILKHRMLKLISGNGVMTKEMLQEVEGKPLSVIMPNQKISVTLLGNFTKEINDISSNKSELFLGINFDYTYGHNNGQYGVITKYNKITGLFDIIETWNK